MIIIVMLKRDAATLATCCAGLLGGIKIFRVHNVDMIKSGCNIFHALR
jgi:dihydropteroate synthase